MLHPSYSDLMNAVNSDVEEGEQPVVNSRYSIVIATSKRARQIIDESGDEGRSLQNGAKPLSMAIDELCKGEVKIISEDDNADDVAEEGTEEAEALEETEVSEEAEADEETVEE